MKLLVTYKSKTGFTLKYAQWIAKRLGADLKEVTKTSASEVKEYDLVIHGGWIMGGMVMGLDQVRKYNPTNLIVFGVGVTAREAFDVAKAMEQNKIKNEPFYYYEGGFNPKKMGFFDRLIVRMVSKKAPEYKDNTDENAIEELIQSVSTINLMNTF